MNNELQFLALTTCKAGNNSLDDMPVSRLHVGAGKYHNQSYLFVMRGVIHLSCIDFEQVRPFGEALL